MVRLAAGDSDDRVGPCIRCQTAKACETDETCLVSSRIAFVQAQNLETRTLLTERVSRFEVSEQDWHVAGRDVRKLSYQLHGLAEDAADETIRGQPIVRQEQRTAGGISETDAS